MKKTLTLLLAVVFLALSVTFAEARGGARRGDRAGRGGADRARDARRTRDAQVQRTRDQRQNRDGLRRDAGRDAV